ncbi:MAG: 4-hydroxythreonine-4-phosphate dehydrogenase PdxA [Candidatus Omnitrophica bacterium]|nr:4-hydroxythreonine-4-phosphate dehydrogenase PdxA [Candidatus Omnitrophota bacterium]
MIAVAVTMGDPAGIGPAVALRALAAPHFRWAGAMRAVFVGDAAWLRGVARRQGIPWRWTVVRRPVAGPNAPAHQLWDVVRVPPGVHPGRIQAAAGRAALEALDCAITLAQVGQVDALVTAPVSKEAIGRSCPGWTGHTEHLARACGVERPVMMFAAGALRASLVTTHQALARAIRSLTPARVEHVVRRTVEALRADWGVPRPRVAIAALNPHAGEGGLFGDDERRWLAPLVRRLARRLPAVVSGPHPADTLFAQQAQGRYDAAIALFHDQALIPIKLLAWNRAVNVTLGLPFVRTSPAHGTAFDIATPRHRPDARSMQAAIELAVTLAHHRRAHPLRR